MVDDAAPPVSRVSGAGRSRFSVSWRSVWAYLVENDVATIAGVWFVIAFGTVLWAWGLNPLVFQVTDEAVVRQAARLISRNGSPVLQLPFNDPEDLAHMRQWMSNGDTALPIYAPVMLYACGLLLRLHDLGLLIIELLPTTALAAFAAGTARLLPRPRRWLALLAPLLGFVSFYWVLHPWLNLSPVLAFLAWAFFFWTSWRADGDARWLWAVAACVGVAASVRPDYAAFLLVSMVLLLLANDLQKWRQILSLAFLAGVCALVPNLIFNKLTTGHALRAVYQIALDKQYGADGTHGLEAAHGMPGFGMLRVLVLPMGFPAPAVAFAMFKKYLLRMSVAPVLLVGQLALVPLIRKKPIFARALGIAALLFFAFFVVTHLHDGFFGADDARGYIYHSIPRYLAPVFLFAPLAPLLFIGGLRRKLPFVLASALACTVAAKSVYDVYITQPAALLDIHRWVSARTRLLTTLDKEIPKNAIVYSSVSDKLLWSKWNIGVIAEPVEQTAQSMNRAVDAGLPVYMVEPRAGLQFTQLRTALRARQFRVVRINGRRGVYRLDRLAPVQLVPPAP